MEKSRKIKILSIVALVLAITGMSLGFAAFSATLNISSSASVSPNSSNFAIVFSTADDWHDAPDSGVKFDLTGTGVGGAIAKTAFLSSYYISGIEANFTNSGQEVNYTFYVHNAGAYDAYLKSINISNASSGNSWKQCSTATTDDTKATDTLVQSACNGIEMLLEVDGKTYDVNEGDLSGILLEKGGVVPINLIIRYKEGSQLADGPFNVSFGTISFNYSTVDNPFSLISFSIGGTSYQAKEGMNWQEWVDSEYNTIQLSYNDYSVHIDYRYFLASVSGRDVEPNDAIIDGEDYYLNKAGYAPDEPHEPI